MRDEDLSARVGRLSRRVVLFDVNVKLLVERESAPPSVRARRRLRVNAYSASAMRSVAGTEPCVGETQAVGQRETPLARMYSSITASK